MSILGSRSSWLILFDRMPPVLLSLLPMHQQHQPLAARHQQEPLRQQMEDKRVGGAAMVGG